MDGAQLALSLYDVAAGAGNWRAALSRLAREAGADEAAVFSARAGERVLSSCENGCFDPGVHDEYLRDFAARDAQMLRAFDAGDGIAISGRDLVSAEELRRCPVHNDYILPHDIGAQLVWFFRTAGGRGHTLALLRSAGAGAFGPEVRRLGELLLPHLRRVLEILATESVSTKVPEPGCTLVLDDGGRIIWSGLSAEALLSSGKLLTDGMVLRPPTRGAPAFEATLRGERGDASVAWPGVAGEVHALRAATAARFGLDAGQTGGVVFLRTDDDRHLSRRERECLVWVARGERTARIAERLGLTERTVSQYLNSAVRRLGARNRTEAAVKAALAGLIHP